MIPATVTIMLVAITSPKEQKMIMTRVQGIIYEHDNKISNLNNLVTMATRTINLHNHDITPASFHERTLTSPKIKVIPKLVTTPTRCPSFTTTTTKEREVLTEKYEQASAWEIITAL